MWVLTLLAQAEGVDKDPFRRPEVIWGTVGLAVALLAGAIVVWGVDRWRKKATQTTDSGAELTDYRVMFERGEITETEYVKLRNKIASRMKTPAPGPTVGQGPPPPPDPGSP